MQRLCLMGILRVRVHNPFNPSSIQLLLSASIKNVAGSSYFETLTLNHRCLKGLHVSKEPFHHLFSQYFSTFTPSEIPWACSSYSTLLNKINASLKDCQVNEAWGTFKDFRNLYGWPSQDLMNELITNFCYSSESHYLQKAFHLVLDIKREKPGLLHHGFLTRLALTLARAQMFTRASTILWLMLEIDKFSPLEAWKSIFLHLVRTQEGTYLASNILLEICDLFSLHKSDSSTRVSKFLKLIKPDTTTFNLVLNACLKFGSILKANELIDRMAGVGIIADANSIIIIALIHERNGLRDELKRLKKDVDKTRFILDQHYLPFYNSLLNLHFMFNDIDSASELVLELYRRPECSHPMEGGSLKGLRISCHHIGSPNLKTGSSMQINPIELQKEFPVYTENVADLVIMKGGNLVPSDRALARIINCYIKDRKVSQLSNLLIKIERQKGFLLNPSLCSDVVDACIQLGWVETAHDIIEDVSSASIPIRDTSYGFLLKAYCNANQIKEAQLLLRQMRKHGMLKNLTDPEAISLYTSKKDTSGNFDSSSKFKEGGWNLVKYLIRIEEEVAPPMVYEINSSIYFFCKAKMMEDALKTFRRMQEKNLMPTVQTFSYLLNGFASLKMYRDITILWGDIRRRIEAKVLFADRDLLEIVLCNFIKGGYFGRVMEIIGYATKYGICIDRLKCKKEFLKLHKDLYRKLKASNAKTEAQRERIYHIQTFKRWAKIT